MVADEIFAVLQHARRAWAVGSIHGEAARLKALHAELIGRLAPGDRLVYCGNYLGHGPEIIATLDELIAFRREFLCLPGAEPWDIAYLRGAQEEMWRKMLELQFAPGPAQVLDWMRAQGAEATLRAYGGDPARGYAAFREGPMATTRWTTGLRAAIRQRPGHDELYAALRRAAYTAGGELLFVHAGIDPQRPLSEQSDTFWWGSANFADMNAPYAGFRLVVRGFDRGHGPARVGHITAAIDGGCGFGGKLIAACFGLDGRALDWIEV